MFAKDIDGKWHTIIDQAKGSSCGPACVRMVVKMVTNKDVGEEQVRQLVEKDEGQAHVATITSERGGAAVAGSHNWGRHGGHGSGRGGFGTWNLPDVLKGYGVAKARVSGDFVDIAFAETSVKNPGIAEVDWNGGGAHWVVVAGSVSDGRFLILDPAYGLQYGNLALGGPQYNPKAGVVGKFQMHTILTN